MRISILIAVMLHVFANTDFAQQTNDAIMFQGNAQHTGVYKVKPPYKLTGVKFIFKTPGAIRGTPCLFRGSIYFGSGDGYFYAVDAESGKELWKYKTGGGIQSSPAASGNLIYFLSRDGYIYGLDVRTGSEVWKFKTGKELIYENGWDYYLASPVIDGDMLYTGSADGYLYSFSIHEKKLIWKFNAGALIRSAPAVAGDVIVFGTMNGSLYALQKKDGTEKWKFNIEGASFRYEDWGFDRSAITSSPSIANGIITVGGRDGYLYAIDLLTGKPKWRIDHETSWVTSTPAIEDGIVYTGTGSSKFIQAIDQQSGIEKWRFPTPYAVFSSVAIAGSMLCVGDYGGNLFALNKVSGKVLWKFSLGDRIHTTPIISNGIIYCGCDNGILYALSGNTAFDTTSDVVRRAVYWEGSNAFNWFQNGVDTYVRDYFKNAGYEVVNAEALKNLMEAQLNNPTSAIVVFADNKIPKSVVEENSAKAIIRQYLDAGGKVVLIGPSPLAYQCNAATGVLDSIDFNISQAVFDIRYPGKNIGAMGYYDSQLTAEGIAVGLHNGFVSYATSIIADQSITVLSRDEFGMANEWIKNYGGKSGTGLLQLSIPRGTATDLSPILNAAEFGLGW